MSHKAVMDLCSDDEFGENEKCKSLIRQENEENRSPSAFSTGYSNSSILDQCDPLHDESSHQCGPSLCPAPICRQFWNAGSYEIQQRQGHKTANQNGKNHLHVHPMFLHSNATSHKWVFGAIAELVDNVIDEIQNRATFVDINKILNPRDGSPALLIQDNGGGMDPEAIRCCMSFGFSKKLKNAIGQYGNGFKASTMRLGADVIVFTRHKTLTQSVGLLSYTFLTRMHHDRIVVPMVDYEFNTSSGTFGPILPHGKELFSSNLSTLLQWYPYSTEEELLKQFDDVGNHGTKIVIYNLWLNDDGDLELDFDSDSKDIRISGDSKLFQLGYQKKPIFDLHIANVYKYSLRVYLSILYLRLPQCFAIKLRGQVVEQHNIASDLKFPEIIVYRPQNCGNDEAAVVTTIGFLKEAPNVNIHGFNIYHRNRLILPFWSALNNRTNSNGRGIVGVLEANSIEPTHNKQDFEKTSLFQKLEDRLKQMTLEYWNLHCELIGYQVKKSPSTKLLPQELFHSRTHNSVEHSMSSNHSSSMTESSGAVPAVGSLQDLVATTADIAGRRHRKSADICQIRSEQGLGIKRKRDNPPVEPECTCAYATDTWNLMEEQLYRRTENQLQDQQAMNLMQQNKKLRLQLSELEQRVEVHNLKVHLLRSELMLVQCEYTKLLAESNSMKEERCMMR